MMRARKIDYLVMQNSEEFLARLTVVYGFPGRHQFPMTVIFPVDDEMTTINCGGDPPADQYPPAWRFGGQKQAGACYFPTIQYTNTMEAEITVGVLKEKKNPTVGLVEQAFIPVPFYKYLVDHLPGAKFVDAPSGGRDQGNQEP